MTFIKHNTDMVWINLNGVDVLYYHTELPCTIPGTVIDIETTGLEPSDAFITGLGIVKWNKLSCFVIDGGANCDEETFGDDYSQEIIDKFERFRDWCISKVEKCPQPLAAYNKGFEQKFLKSKFLVELQAIPYQRKDSGYYNHYSKRQMNAAIKIDHLGESIDNKEMIYASADKIMKHLIQDMYAELALYVTKANVVRRQDQFLPGALD